MKHEEAALTDQELFYWFQVVGSLRHEGPSSYEFSTDQSWELLLNKPAEVGE
jgi:hypothetical protein